MSNWEKTKKKLDKLDLNYSTLSKDQFAWFKEACNKAKLKNKLTNDKLIGHIKEEYEIEYPPENIVKMLVGLIDSKFSYYLKTLTMLSKDVPFDLDQIWCNFQKKNEFNPPHDHTGVFSFVIFIKIPYDLKNEIKCFNTGGEVYNSKFVFHVINKLGKIQMWPLEVDKSFEGKIIFFPATQVHEVFPFYTSNDYRITVSGNIKLRVENA